MVLEGMVETRSDFAKKSSLCKNKTPPNWILFFIKTHIFSPLIASADSCSFFFLSFSVPFFELHVIHLIYQVKGIRGHQWVCVGCVRVCAGVPGCGQVCTGVHKCARVYPGVCGYAWVCAGVGESTGVCGGVRDCARVCVDLHRGAHLCVG